MQPNISHMTNQMAQMHMQQQHAGGAGGAGSQYIISGGYPGAATHQGSWQMSQQSHQQTQIQVRRNKSIIVMIFVTII